MEYSIEFSSLFIKKYRNLETFLQDEVDEKVELLKHKKNHERLRVHKLGGRLKGIYSFSVSYKIRVTFSLAKRTVILLERIGTHDEVY